MRKTLSRALDGAFIVWATYMQWLLVRAEADRAAKANAKRGTAVVMQQFRDALRAWGVQKYVDDVTAATTATVPSPGSGWVAYTQAARPPVTNAEVAEAMRTRAARGYAPEAAPAWLAGATVGAGVGSFYAQGGPAATHEAVTMLYRRARDGGLTDTECSVLAALTGTTPEAVRAELASQRRTTECLDRGECPVCSAAVRRTRDPRQVGALHPQDAATPGTWFNYRCGAPGCTWSGCDRRERDGADAAPPGRGEGAERTAGGTVTPPTTQGLLNRHMMLQNLLFKALHENITEQDYAELAHLLHLSQPALRAMIAAERSERIAVLQGVCPQCRRLIARTRDPRESRVPFPYAPGAWFNYRCGEADCTWLGADYFEPDDAGAGAAPASNTRN